MDAGMIANLAVGALLGVNAFYLRRLTAIIDRIDGDLRRLEGRVLRIEVGGSRR